MKSYNNIEDSLKNKSGDDFIFKQTQLNKMYSYGTLSEIRRFQQKHKCNLYEYVDYNAPIRLFFYIKIVLTKYFHILQKF